MSHWDREQDRRPTYFQCYHKVYESPAFRDLDAHEYALYTELRRRYSENSTKTASKRKVLTGNADRIILTYNEVRHLMCKQKCAKAQRSLWEHGLIQYAKHGALDRSPNVFRIDGYDKNGNLIELPWVRWKKDDPKFVKSLMKGPPPLRNNRRYSEHHFGAQWKNNAKEMRKKVRGGMKRRGQKAKADAA